MKSKKKRPPRPVPVLTDKQEALLTAISDSCRFTLAAVLARYPSGPSPAEVMQALKEASIARTVADANAAAKAGTLRPITPEQYAVLERAAPKRHGKVISSILDTLDAADNAMTSKLEPNHACKN